uniref:Uncharacterized protein n=1 Tax=Timema poppense TaxID=170557 RepID=A0A7R9DNV5_TIMPO|nr:unnamed protein product [Timema poppensis]
MDTTMAVLSLPYRPDGSPDKAININYSFPVFFLHKKMPCIFRFCVGSTFLLNSVYTRGNSFSFTSTPRITEHARPASLA